MSTHHATTDSTTAANLESMPATFRAVCSCGYVGPELEREADANAYAVEHIAGVLEAGGSVRGGSLNWATGAYTEDPITAAAKARRGVCHVCGSDAEHERCGEPELERLRRLPCR